MYDLKKNVMYKFFLFFYFSFYLDAFNIFAAWPHGYISQTCGKKLFPHHPFGDCCYEFFYELFTHYFSEGDSGVVSIENEEKLALEKANYKDRNHKSLIGCAVEGSYAEIFSDYLAGKGDIYLHASFYNKSGIVIATASKIEFGYCLEDSIQYGILTQEIIRKKVFSNTCKGKKTTTRVLGVYYGEYGYYAAYCSEKDVDRLLGYLSYTVIDK